MRLPSVLKCFGSRKSSPYPFRITGHRAIGLRRPEYEQVVLEAAVPRLVGAVVDPESSQADDFTGSAKTIDNAEGSGFSKNAPQGVNDSDQVVSYDNVGRALSALVELSEMPRVFGVAARTMLAGEIRAKRRCRGRPLGGR